MTFHLPNSADAPMKGFQLKAVAVSENGWHHGYSNPFDALVDPGARHTCVSDKIMQRILKRITDKNGDTLVPVGHGKAGGVYGDVRSEPFYILPHFYLGRIHLLDVAVMVLHNSNIDCLIGRSILHQCVLTLDPEENAMTFDFKDSLKSRKQLIDGLLPFERVELFVEGIDSVPS